MALLGGIRDSAGTIAYLEHNVKHWADYGFGMWMLRDAGTRAVIGRAILRHLDIGGVDEVEVGYGFMPDTGDAVSRPRSHEPAYGLDMSGSGCDRSSRSPRPPTSSRSA